MLPMNGLSTMEPLKVDEMQSCFRSRHELDLREYSFKNMNQEKLLATLKAIYSRGFPDENPLGTLHLPKHFYCDLRFLTSLSEICPQLQRVTVKARVYTLNELFYRGLWNRNHPQIQVTTYIELKEAIRSPEELIEIQNKCIQENELYGLHIAIESREYLHKFLEFFKNPPAFKDEPIWQTGDIAMLTLKVPDLKQEELDFFLRMKVTGLTIEQSHVSEIHSLTLNKLVCKALNDLRSIEIPNAVGLLDVNSCFQLQSIRAPNVRKLKLYQCLNMTVLEAYKARSVDIKKCQRIGSLVFVNDVDNLVIEHCPELRTLDTPKAKDVKLHHLRELGAVLFPIATKVELFDCPMLIRARLLKIKVIDIRECPALNVLDAPEAQWEEENSQMRQLTNLIDLNIPSFVNWVCVNDFSQLRILNAPKAPRIFAERTPQLMRIHGPARDYTYMLLCASLDFIGIAWIAMAGMLIYSELRYNRSGFVVNLILLPVVTMFAVIIGGLTVYGSREARHVNRQLVR